VAKIKRAIERLREDEDKPMLEYIEYIGRKGEVLKEQEEGVRAEVEGLRIRNEGLREKIRR
jgi:hypothetical protein